MDCAEATTLLPKCTFAMKVQILSSQVGLIILLLLVQLLSCIDELVPACQKGKARVGGSS